MSQPAQYETKRFTAFPQHGYEIVDVKTCNVVKRFSDRGLAEIETDLLNQHGHNVVLCHAGGFLVSLDDLFITLT